MARNILFLIGSFSLITGAVIFLAPQPFYESTPGLELMGPFNVHFLRDVGLAFLASGGAMIWGGWRFVPPVAVAGAAWPLLHALFHIQIWGARGFPFDSIAAFDLVAVVIPASLGAWAAWRLEAPA